MFSGSSFTALLVPVRAFLRHRLGRYPPRARIPSRLSGHGRKRI
jgi:hypothetical protein